MTPKIPILAFATALLVAMGAPPSAPAADPQPLRVAVAATTIQTGSGGDAITIPAFRVLLAQAPGSVHLIDVRSPEEFAKGAFPGTVNIPIDDLEDRVGELPADKPIIFVCSTGTRSGEAYDIVKLLREDLEVYFLNANVTYRQDGDHVISEPHG